ncbi:GGDEF domain-containing protein [Algisphaera agarilytica]|uniref:Diguanylate cyclase (GGDEF)-like protein n=1 Tax=Algisphaera agarilytica TaxID=1385975 RepID=A0A7X0H442_9BACT|nr:GGDEF domain-containing protein [Algisphaera agarilytica]MBB6428728.1 diguanylate cyclase (GGDEF)-like protein [Algisphaera agarilytica]
MRLYGTNPHISKWHWLTAGVLAVLCVMGLDIVTGREVSFSLFYLVPIGIVCLKVGGRSAMLIAGLSAAAWAEAEVLSGTDYSHVAIPFWNAVVRLSFFLTFTILIQSLRTAIARQHDLARTDVLTGAVNRRSFFETLMYELARSQRYGRGFALVYLDLDHFKQVNDQLGHAEGDRVLVTVVEEMQKRLRRTDTVARLGGDEFALLLPEIPPLAAELLIAKLRFELLESMRREGWSITFSIGLLNCDGRVEDEDALVRQVDQLMYAVKRSGRDNLRIANAWEFLNTSDPDPIASRHAA